MCGGSGIRERAVKGLPGGSAVKDPPANAGDADSISGSGGSPAEKDGKPLQSSCLEKSHGQRSLAGNSPWGCKEWVWLSDLKPQPVAVGMEHSR